MKHIKSVIDTCIKPLLFINSYNDFKIFFQQQVISLRIKTGTYAFYPKVPPKLHIEPTNFCNIKCICCSSRRSSREKGYMDFNLFQKIIDEASKIGVKRIHLYLHGEPMLHPQIIEMISYIKSKFLSIYFVTNGMLFDREKSKAILQSGVNNDDIFTFSILGYSKEVHERVMKGVDHDKVVKNISDFLILREKFSMKRPAIKCVFGKIPENIHEKDRFIRHWSNIVDHVETELLSESFRFYKQKETTIVPRKYTCIMLWERMMIFWNGDVTICCSDVDGNYILGNLKDKSINEIWSCKQLLSIKKLHEKKKYQKIPLCANCDML